MLVYVRPSNEALLRARVPGAQDQRGCTSFSSCAFCEQGGRLVAPSSSFLGRAWTSPDSVDTWLSHRRPRFELGRGIVAEWGVTAPPIMPHPVCGIADDRCVHASESRRRSRHRHLSQQLPVRFMLAVMPWVASRCWTASRRTGCRDPSGAGALPWVSGSPATWRGHARSNPQSTGGPLPSRSRGASTGRAPRRGRASPPWSRRRDVSGPHPVGLRDLELPGEGIDGPGHVWPESVVARHFFTGVAQIPSMRMSRAMRFSPIPWPRAALRGCSRLTVLGARPKTDIIVRSEWPWARSRLKVSRPSVLMCR